MKTAIRREQFAQHMGDVDKELEAAEKAAEAMVSGTPPKPEETPAVPALKPASPAPKETPPPEPTAPPAEPLPEPAKAEPKSEDKDAADLKAQLADRDAKLAALQAKLDKQSGEFGGTLEKLRNEIRDFGAQTARLQAERDQAREAVKAAKETKPATSPTRPVQVVPKEVREMFPEFADVLDETMADLRSQIEEVRKAGGDAAGKAEAVQQRVIADAKARFDAALYGAVPDFDALNYDPAFGAAVNEPDEFGRTMAATLNQAFANMDAGPIIKFVEKYRAKAKGGQTDAEREAQRQAEAEKAERLKREASPGAAASARAAPPPKAEEETKKRAQRIKEYEVLVSSGRHPGKEQAAQYSKDKDAQLSEDLARLG
ncbi:MAG: hypothetical protein ABIH03_06040 [Pseudomonadota bacterium]